MQKPGFNSIKKGKEKEIELTSCTRTKLKAKMLLSAVNLKAVSDLSDSLLLFLSVHSETNTLFRQF